MFILNFSFILYSLLFYVLFLFLGLGLTILFCPKEWRKYTVFLSPLIGYCLLTLTGWFFYTLNFKGTDSYYYWILLLALLLLTGAIIKVWKQKFLKELFSRELIIPILIAIVVFLAIAFPSLRQKEMTSVSIGNNDIANYALASQIIQGMPKSDFHLIDYFNADSTTNPELGGYINPGFFCSVVKLAPYQVQMINIYIFFIISLFLTYILGREVFKYTNFASSIIILLYGLSSLLYYVIYHGFERQIIAVPLMLLIMLSNMAVVRANKFMGAIRHVPFLILSFWGLSLTYVHMFVIIYGLIISYVLLSYCENRNVTKILNWAAINCIALLVIVCLSPQRLQVVISHIFFMSNLNAGWFMTWITPQELFGVIPFGSPYSMAVTIAVSVISIVLIISGFVKLYRSDRENFLFVSVTFPLIIIGALFLSYWNITRAYGGFGGYNQFKLISFFLPLLLLSSFALFGKITFNINNIRNRLKPVIESSQEHLIIEKKTLYFVIIAALIIANCFSAGITLGRVVKSAAVVPADAIDLKVIRNNNEIKSINIPADGGGYWNIMWEAYFLFPKKLFFEQPTYYAASPLNGEWSLVRKSTEKENTEKVLSVSTRNESNSVILINSTYSLIKTDNLFTAKY